MFLFHAISFGQSVIMGKVIEEGTGNPLEFSNISLMLPADSSMVSATVSGEGGSFELQAQPGGYLLRV